MIEPVLLRLLDRCGCGGELLIVGFNRPQNSGVYLVFNGLGCSPYGIFDRERRTCSMSDNAHAIYAEQRHATVLLIIGLFPNRLAPSASFAPSLRTGFLKRSSLSQDNIAWATASVVLRTTLPVNPSQTTTSAGFSNRSCPSMLPRKLSPLAFNSLKAYLVTSLPRMSSSPIDINATEGLL